MNMQVSSSRSFRTVLALSLLCLTLTGPIGADEYKDEIYPALKALASPEVNLHALRKFEDILLGYPELGSLVNDDVRRARAHKKKWDALLEKMDARLPTMRVSYSPTKYKERLRRWSSKALQVKLAGGQLKAQLPSGDVKWSVPWGEGPIKVLSYKERLLIIEKEGVSLLNPENGKTVTTWPGELTFKVRSFNAPVVWKAWEHADTVMGADSQYVYVVFGHWFLALRQKDADGWAHYFGYDIRAKRSADGKVLVLQNHAGRIFSYRLSDGHQLWTYKYGEQLQAELLDVGETEIDIYVPEVGKVVTISRESGTFVRELSHQSL